jgi:photosystem II stability/assembly factor-like uncharacterized protein
MTRRRLVALAVAAATLLTAAGSFAQSPTTITSLTLFAGTREGLWRSGDWAQSWQRVTGGTTGVRLDTLGPARLVVPMGPEVYVAGDGGLYVSEDFGETWEILSPTTGVRSLLFSRWPQADPTVFVGTGRGLLRSRDGGRTFDPTPIPTGPVHRLEWPGPALVVASGAGLLVSKDEGETFADPGPGLPPGGVVAMALSSFFAVDPVLFVAPLAGGVFRSADGGATWEASGLAGEIVRDLIWLGPFLYAAADAGFFRSEDGGRSWTRLSSSPGRPVKLMFPLAPAAGLEAFLATDRGVFRTPDAGQTWALAGFEGQEVLTVATFPPPRPDLVPGSER